MPYDPRELKEEHDNLVKTQGRIQKLAKKWEAEIAKEHEEAEELQQILRDGRKAQAREHVALFLCRGIV